MEFNRKVFEQEMFGHKEVLSNLLNRYFDMQTQLEMVKEKITQEKAMVSTLKFILDTNGGTNLENQNKESDGK